MIKRSSDTLLRTLLNLYIPVMIVAMFVPIVTAVVLLVLGLFGTAISSDFCCCMVLLVPIAGILGLAGFVHIGYFFLTSWDGDEDEENEDEITIPQSQMGKLILLVDDVAEKWRLPKPNAIRLTAQTAAYVRETRKGKKILVIGAVAVASLPQDALAAIIAHELAHFAGGDTKLVHQESLGIRMMSRLSHALQVHPIHWLSPAMWLVGPFHLWVRGVWAANSREQEYLADTYAVDQAGKEVTGAVLIYVHVVEELPWANIHTIAESFIATGEPTSRIFAEQVYLAKRTSKKTWRAAVRKELEKPTGMFDDHPCLSERLKAIDVDHDEALKMFLNYSGPQSTDLFEDWSSVENKVGQKITVLYHLIASAKRDAAAIILGKNR